MTLKSSGELVVWPDLLLGVLGTCFHPVMHPSLLPEVSIMSGEKPPLLVNASCHHDRLQRFPVSAAAGNLAIQHILFFPPLPRLPINTSEQGSV